MDRVVIEDDNDGEDDTGTGGCRGIWPLRHSACTYARPGPNTRPKSKEADMMDRHLRELLNDQFNKELYSAYLYMDFADYYHNRGLHLSLIHI